MKEITQFGLSLTLTLKQYYPEPSQSSRLILTPVFLFCCRFIKSKRARTSLDFFSMEKKFQSLNPYIAGNPINNPKGFFGRDDVFREVMQMLRQPQSNAIVLYGQRRIGKTSVLLQLEQRLAANGEYTPVYLDLQDKAAKPLAEVLYDLAQRIALKVGQHPPDRAQFDDEGAYFRQAFLPAAAHVAAQGGEGGC